jgi:hypothetical protein
VAELRRVYIDTCCFIDLIRVEIGKGVDADKENDVWHVKKLLEAHRDGELECDEDEDAFDERLKKLATAPKPAPKKDE